MDYTDQIVKLCQGNEHLNRGRRGLAIESAVPVLELLNRQVFEATRAAMYCRPKYKRIYLTRHDYWMVMEAQGFGNTSLNGVRTLGWNKYFGDDSDERTFLGTLIRSGKQYAHADHSPDQLCIRALSFLASLAAHNLHTSIGFDMILAVPSSRHSTNGLPSTIARSVAGHLGVQFHEVPVINYVRDVRQMKAIVHFDDKISEIRGAMHAEPSLVTRRSVLVIDDLLASGLTLREVARALRAAGAQQVYALTLAKTRRFAMETMNNHVHDQ